MEKLRDQSSEVRVSNLRAGPDDSIERLCTISVRFGVRRLDAAIDDAV
jgi:hypothetical protein